MNTDTLIDEIIKGKTNIMTPIFNEMAYLDVELTNNKNCLINLGDNYYVKTKLEKAKEISKRINLEKAKKDTSINKLDDNTFDIRENIAVHEEEEKKKEEKKKKEKKEEKKDKEDLNEKIRKENEMLLAKINEFKNKKGPIVKRLKLKKKEEIIDIVLKKLNHIKK